MLQNLPNENWMAVRGYEGIYEVSNLSRIKSLPRMVNSWKGSRLTEEKILTPCVHKTGYSMVCLRKDNNSKVCRFHILIAVAFIENPFNKKQINHINGVKSDNRIENLEWRTNSENQKHSYTFLGKKKTWLNKKRPSFSNEHKGSISYSKNGGKVILNKETGIFYDSIPEAAFVCGIKRRTLGARLLGQITNKSSFIYV